MIPHADYHVFISPFLQVCYSCHSQYEINDACVVSWSDERDDFLVQHWALLFPWKPQSPPMMALTILRLCLLISLKACLCVCTGLTSWVSAPTAQRMNLGSRKQQKTVSLMSNYLCVDLLSQLKKKSYVISCLSK